MTTKRVETRICDRCGYGVPNSGDFLKGWGTMAHGAPGDLGSGFVYDLCRGCRDSLLEWLADPPVTSAASNEVTP